MWFKHVWFQWGKRRAVNSSTNQVGNVVMNWRPELAPRLTFCMLTAQKKNRHRRQRRKNLWDQKETTNSQSNYSGLNPCPQLPPLRFPFQSFWSSALISALEGTSAFEPLQPMAKSRNATGGACVSADQKTAGGNVATWRLWASSWPSTNGRCLQQVLIQRFNWVFACTLKKHQGRFCQVSWTIWWFLEVSQERSKVTYLQRSKTCWY